MSRILLIETWTALCSVALAVDGKVVASRESDQPRSHAAMTAPFIKELLDSRGMFASDLDAVCVSAGPGSYTGLRVGVSTAKGICFAAGVPLLSVGTLEVLVGQARTGGLVPEGCRYIIPLLDARRMEVYTAVFSPDGERLTEVEPRVIDAGSFAKERSEGPKSKKLLHFVLDDGTGTDRIILSGIKEFYQPEELNGKSLVAITNLPPRKMMGIESCGMLLSAIHTQDGKESLHLLMVDDDIPAGAKLY